MFDFDICVLGQYHVTSSVFPVSLRFPSEDLSLPILRLGLLVLEFQSILFEEFEDSVLNNLMFYSQI